MPSFAEFEAEMRPLHNHICMLYDQEMVRLIGVGHDDTDLYYIVQKLEKPRHTFSKDHLMWASAVGHILSLKECLPAVRYAGLDDHFERMGLDPTEEFEVTDKCIWDQEISEQFNYVSKCGRFVITLDVGNPDLRFKLSRRYPDKPDEQDAYIMHGEMVALQDIVSAMIDQISEWETFQETTDKAAYKKRFAKFQAD
jgi:hypothetical protein